MALRLPDNTFSRALFKSVAEQISNCSNRRPRHLRYYGPVDKTFSNHLPFVPVKFTCRYYGSADVNQSGRLSSPSPLSSLSKTVYRPLTTNKIPENSRTGKEFFPWISEKIVAYWLLGSAASVFGIVVFGGLTRLTESGSVFFFSSSRRIHILT